ncbi:DR2241 family protein [Halovenus salina]|uniref:DR2241 family protein n=1 Tax=Halovenus salina TaxID=1510225 RepID=UPI003F63F195
MRSEAAQAFEDWLQPVPETGRQFGELTIEARASGYELRHTDDDRANETVSLEDLRETVRFDQHGRYRPFAGERSLPAGWRVSVADTAELMTAVATVYPTAVEDWYATQTGGVDPVPWSAVASRQTGIYASVDDLDQGTVDRTVDAVCDGCVRCPAWRETGDDGTTIPCLEPCSFLVAAAREFDAHGATADTDSLHSSEDVERGDLTDPANRYRVRYSRQASKLTQK